MKKHLSETLMHFFFFKQAFITSDWMRFQMLQQSSATNASPHSMTSSSTG